MPDPYATIAEAEPALQERLAGILELRAADPQQRAMLGAYLADIAFPPGARVLEIGCGTGPVTRALAVWPGVGEVVGADPSPVFIAKARELSAAQGNLAFEVADGRALRFADGDFDAVVFHTTLCHIPQPERALAEAFRVLRPGGTLAIFDGDSASITVALGETDPLQDSIEAVKAAFINDLWLVRRLPTLLRSAGFEMLGSRSHGYLQTSRPEYMLTLVDRGADNVRHRPAMSAAMPMSMPDAPLNGAQATDVPTRRRFLRRGCDAGGCDAEGRGRLLIGQTQQPEHGNVLAEVGPVDPKALVDDLPMRPLLECGVRQPREALDGDAEIPSVGQVHPEHVAIDPDLGGLGADGPSDGGSHAMPAPVVRGVLRRSRVARAPLQHHSRPSAPPRPGGARTWRSFPLSERGCAAAHRPR
jgi:SAM-dependent methyltransferase